jgi:hypothetical protein
MVEFCTNTLPAYDPMKMKWTSLVVNVSGFNIGEVLEGKGKNEEEDRLDK